MRCVLTRCAGVSWRIERIGKALDRLGHSKSQNFCVLEILTQASCKGELAFQKHQKAKDRDHT